MGASLKGRPPLTNGMSHAAVAAAAAVDNDDDDNGAAFCSRLEWLM